jgi:hypothetical protein
MIGGGGLSVLWGASQMHALGRETVATAAHIGLGILAAMVGFLFLFNFLWAVRLVRSLRRGDGVIARWRVAPATFELFRSLESGFRAQGDENDYRIPRATPNSGVEIIFSADSVLVGDTFFGLTSTGFARFRNVRMLPTNPPVLEFDTTLTWATNRSQVLVHHTRGALRVPVAANAHRAAAKVLAHYENVISRKILVKPDFWRRRIRWGLIAALVGGTVSAGGFALQAADPDGGVVPLVMAVLGALVAPAGMVLSLCAWLFSALQRGTFRKLK